MIIQASYNDSELSRRRLEIARHTSVPSLAYQTRKPIVHIATNPADPHYAARIELYQSTGCVVRVLDRPEWKLYGEDWELPDGRKIVSRMDDDDVICKEFCEATYNAAPGCGECAMIWPNGYVFWREMIFALTHPGIQFVTLATDHMKDPHQEQHWQYHKRWINKTVSHNVGWIWVRHGDAATSTLPRYRKHHVRRIDTKRIPINLRAIVRAVEESGVPSENYIEHMDQRTLKHVLKENAAHAQ